MIQGPLWGLFCVQNEGLPTVEEKTACGRFEYKKVLTLVNGEAASTVLRCVRYGKPMLIAKEGRRWELL